LVDTNNLTGYAQVVEELQNGTVTKQYTYGLDLISQRQSSGISFYNYDGHGSVRGLSNNLGSVTDTYTYDDFGTIIERTGNTSNSYLYAGEQFDSDLGFYYNRARYLNVNTGRFFSQDSYEGDSKNPISLHKYLYANADGINRIDPSGNFSLTEALTVVTVITVLATMPSCTSVLQHFAPPRTVSFGWFIDKIITMNLKAIPIDSNEMTEIKEIAMSVFRKAYEDYVVTVQEGDVGNKMNVRDQIGDACGATFFPGASVSTIYYATIKSEADMYAKELKITERAKIIQGVGRGIGNTAAHEFLHQLDIIKSHNTDDRLSYSYHACDRWEQFYGEDFHWSPIAREELDRSLLKKSK
jgi:RHS repeat-associated protein